MIDMYLNQSASWKALTGFDSYGKATWGTGTTINVRWESRQEKVINPQGAEVLSKGVFYCREDIKAGDLLTFGSEDMVVLTVNHYPGLDGNIVYREVAV